MPAAVLPNFAPDGSSRSVNASAWARSSPSRPSLGPADQLEAGRDVAPLVGAAHLQLDAEGPVQMPEVGRLEQHVAELRERQAAAEPRLDGVLREHVRDREVLPDVAQELQHRQLAQPVEVVDHDGGVRALEREEALQLRADSREVRLERRAIQQVPLGGGARRVADHAGAAADEHDRPAAALLEVDEGRDRHEVADVERRTGRVEPVVGGNLAAGRQAGGERRRRIVEEASPAQLVEEAGQAVGRSIGGVARRRGRHSERAEASRPEARGVADRTSPHAIVHADMQTSLARRQRHRRLGTRRRPRGSTALKRTAIAIPIILLVVFIGAGVTGFLGVVAAYSYYANGLPNPEAALADLEFDQQTIVYDRTGVYELARLGERKREIVGFSELTPEVLDATTAIEDKDFWVNPGFDFAGFVCRHRRHDQRPAPRRLDDHPAARPGPPPAAERLRGQPRGAQDPRDHPVGPADPGLPGREGQAADHHGVPEPELLRQPVVWREGGRRAVLRQGARRAHARGGRDPRRDPPVADEVRPDEERRAGLRRGRPRGRHLPQVQPRRPDDERGRRSAATTSSTG